MQKIDYAKLLGFNAVSDKLSDGIDFQDDTLGDKLGAKVGRPEPQPINVVETR